MHSRVAPIRPAGVPTGISSHGGISLPVGPKHAVRLGGYQDAIGRGQFPGYGCLASLGSQEGNRILDAPGVDDIMRLESPWVMKNLSSGWMYLLTLSLKILTSQSFSRASSQVRCKPSEGWGGGGNLSRCRKNRPSRGLAKDVLGIKAKAKMAVVNALEICMFVQVCDGVECSF